MLSLSVQLLQNQQALIVQTHEFNAYCYINLGYILILRCHLRLGFPNVFFPSRSRTRAPYPFRRPNNILCRLQITSVSTKYNNGHRSPNPQIP